MENNKRTYRAIGIRCDYKTNTVVGNPIYAVYFCDADGEIYGPFRVKGSKLDDWHVRRGTNTSGRWIIEAHMTPNFKEIIDRITKEVEQ